jgi:putative spermidine/putrescine transport system substrate-binding protein
MAASDGASIGPQKNMEVRVKHILSLSVSGVALAVAFSTVDVPKAAAADQITIVSWGGAYQESQRKAYYEPYAKEKGIKVVEEEYDGELGKLKAMKEAGNVTWDVLDVDSAHALAGCDEGLLASVAC